MPVHACIRGVWRCMRDIWVDEWVIAPGFRMDVK